MQQIPLREALPWGSLRERARVRAKTKRQIEVTMFNVSAGNLEELSNNKVVKI